MPVSKISVKLSGADATGGDVTLQDFYDFCGSLIKCLHAVEKLVAESGRIKYRISDLSSGSASMVIEPVPPETGGDPGKKIVGMFIDTVGHLEEGKEVDSRYTSDDLRTFRRLAEPLINGIAKIQIAGKRITTDLIESVDKLIGISLHSHGSVSGRIQRLNFRNRFEFSLYPPIRGVVVICSFDEEMIDKVLSAARRMVTVTGHQIFRPGSPFPEKIKVSTLEIHPPDDQLPRLSELRGLLKGGIGGMSTMEFIQSKRDE